VSLNKIGGIAHLKGNTYLAWHSLSNKGLDVYVDMGIGTFKISGHFTKQGIRRHEVQIEPHVKGDRLGWDGGIRRWNVAWDLLRRSNRVLGTPGYRESDY
jgi:hypothetical protein